MRCLAFIAASLLGHVLVQPGEAHAGSAARRLAATGLCAKEGPAASSEYMNAERTCLQLYSKGAPIQAPADSSTTKWGQISPTQMYSTGPAPTVFQDRNGKQYPISPSAKPPTDLDQLRFVWPLLLVKAVLSKAKVTSFTVVLYVPFGTVLGSLAGTQFEGQLNILPPVPAGPRSSNWFRWTLAKTTDGKVLHATFDNLFTPIKDKKGKCQPALCADPKNKSAECMYYQKYFNTSTDVTLSWDPNMHAPEDSELVLSTSPDHITWMTGFVHLYELMLPQKMVPRQLDFFVHGTPMGTPNLVGTLTKATKASVPCKLP